MDKNGRRQYELFLNERYSRDLNKGKIERSNFRLNKEFLKRINTLKEGDKILEIGCGAGSMIAHLSSRGYCAIGTDASDVLLVYAKKKHRECVYLKMYGEDLNFKNNIFDAVLSFDLFEHIREINNHLKEVYRVLKKEGYYIFSTPNKYTNLPYSIIRDRSLTRWRKYHPSLQTRKSLRNLLEMHGFTIEIHKLKSGDFIKSKLVFPFNRINFDKIPIMTNFYVTAQKI